MHTAQCTPAIFAENEPEKSVWTENRWRWWGVTHEQRRLYEHTWVEQTHVYILNGTMTRFSLAELKYEHWAVSVVPEAIV